MRGEDQPLPLVSRKCEGSPPHARGRRSIPNRSERTGRDHPRMRGEDNKLREAISTNRGSPPHARGRRHGQGHGSSRVGITPACAGKTMRGKEVYPVPGDHPRMRGEDESGGHRRGGVLGSPPHARGRPGPGADDALPVGITPACAGKTRIGLLCCGPG